MKNLLEHFFFFKRWHILNLEKKPLMDDFNSFVFSIFDL